ncbi:MAG TPA: AmmeMemoRadiSam system protein A, partial [Burkholderiales bacterium]|nr:AmmeMemoRadiSam system protein A [Burkholderiales bacterium]
LVEDETGRVLLPIARAAIARDLGRTHSADELAPWLREPGACFITLMQQERLRGCIGTLRAHRALVDDVKANARAAAFRDPRFKPLAAHELDETDIEISVLSALEVVRCTIEQEAVAQLTPGVHGVVFEYGHHSSTFLPQVWAQLADPAEFMGELKRKAGLPPDFWDTEVKLMRYTVSKWREADLGN